MCVYVEICTIMLIVVLIILIMLMIIIQLINIVVIMMIILILIISYIIMIYTMCVYIYIYIYNTSLVACHRHLGALSGDRLASLQRLMWRDDDSSQEPQRVKHMHVSMPARPHAHEQAKQTMGKRRNDSTNRVHVRVSCLENEFLSQLLLPLPRPLLQGEVLVWRLHL